jgi:hypothetical protein
MPPKRELVVVTPAVANKKTRTSISKAAVTTTPAVQDTRATKINPASRIAKPVRKATPPPAKSTKMGRPASSAASSLSPSLSMPPPAPIAAKTNHRYHSRRYPWDDHQDDIVVNSVEDASPDALTGFEHYRHMMKKGGYERICTDFNDYRCNGKPTEDLAEPEIEEEKDITDNEDGYTALPDHVKDYTNPIYAAKTTNPAVFLAITRIAQRNLAFIDLNSALNHIPNLSPTQPYPKLNTGVFIDEVPHQQRSSDIDMTIAFLPRFYNDEAHAIGFYSSPSCSSSTCLFTPCSTADLDASGMIDWTTLASKTKDGDHKRNVQAVGSRRGRWMKADVVEDWEEWKRVQMMVGEGWSGRVRGCKAI